MDKGMAHERTATRTVTAPRPVQAQAQAAAGRPKLNPDEKVLVWPYLVRIEFIAALLFLLLLSLMAVFIDAPLAPLANPDVTPNPAKAPWYFLGLQELLLHMDKALAGVIVPGAVLLGLAALPYIDVRRKGTGIWFHSKRGVPITLFSFFYTAAWNVSLILIDEFLPVPGEAGAHGIGPIVKYWLSNARDAGWLFGVSDRVINAIAGWIVPTFIMLFIPASLVLILRRRWQADTREAAMGLFTFFVASFLVLTIVGTAFRGPGMRLMWPWEVGAANH
ncbi:MAG: menaquinol-cytochrome C reductase [Bacillota bacterium]